MQEDAEAACLQVIICRKNGKFEQAEAGNHETVARWNVAESVLSMQEVNPAVGKWVIVDFVNEPVQVVTNLRG